MLDLELPALRIDGAQGEQRQTAEVVERHALVDALIEARHQRHVEPELLTASHERYERLVAVAREGEDDVLDVAVEDHVLEIRGCAQDGGAAIHDLQTRRRIGVEEPDRPQAVLGMVLQPAGDMRPHPARADDQRGLAQQSVGPRPAL